MEDGIYKSTAHFPRYFVRLMTYMARILEAA